MHVAADRLRKSIIEILEVTNDITERAVRLMSFEIADVLTDENVFVDRKGNAILQIATDDDRTDGRPFEQDRQLRITASPTYDLFTPKKYAHDQIVCIAPDRTVVNQINIGN